MKNKKLFILGSGFSKDIADIPTLFELSKLLQDRYPELPIYIQEFLKKVPEVFHSNIEDHLSYLLMDLPWSNATDAHLRKATFLELSRELANLIIEREESYGGDQENLKRLVELWHAWKSDVITFNYDTLIERTVWRHLLAYCNFMPLQGLFILKRLGTSYY